MAINFYEFPDNRSGAVSIPISQSEVPIATVTTFVRQGEVVGLIATIGWQATGPTSPTAVRYTLWRGAPLTGASVSSAIDSGETNFDNFVSTSFAHIDTGFTSNQSVTYVLTAQLLSPGTAALVIGGLVLTAQPLMA